MQKVFLGIDIFEAIKYVTTPIALIAYLCALVTYYFIHRNINERRKLKINPDIYVETAERLKIDLNLISEDQRAGIVMQIVKNRIISQIIIAISIIVGGIIVSIILLNKKEKEISKPIYIYKVDTLQNTDTNPPPPPPRKFSVQGDAGLDVSTISTGLARLHYSLRNKIFISSDPIDLKLVGSKYQYSGRISVSINGVTKFLLTDNILIVPPEDKQRAQDEKNSQINSILSQKSSFIVNKIISEN